MAPGGENIGKADSIASHAQETSLSLANRPVCENYENKMGGSHLPPSVEAAVSLKWNRPRINIWRTFAVFLSFLIMGANDATYGAIIPFLETYYDLSYVVVSLVFLSPVVGYFLSALSNNRIHITLGRRGVAFLGPGLRLLAYIIISQHPPYALLVLAYMLAGFGVGLEDAAWNAWVGIMQNANEILGILHGFYGLGATLSPLICTAMITKSNLSWYTFYYLMIGISGMNVIITVTAFWSETGKRYREMSMERVDVKGGRTMMAVRNKITWICAFFLLFYTGIEVSLGGWIVVFMKKIRHAAPFPAGMSATAYWLGVTVGRVALGFVTPWIGEKLAILVYTILALVSHILLWLVPSIPISITTISIVGFFIGPFFPSAVIAATKLLPSDLHVASIGFAAAIGAAGASTLPFVVGAIAQARGVQVLMPIVLAALTVDGVIWACLPGGLGLGMGKLWTRQRSSIEEGSEKGA